MKFKNQIILDWIRQKDRERVFQEGANRRGSEGQDNTEIKIGADVDIGNYFYIRGS
jgi:hypothetical protein